MVNELRCGGLAIVILLLLLASFLRHSTVCAQTPLKPRNSCLSEVLRMQIWWLRRKSWATNPSRSLGRFSAVTVSAQDYL